MEKLIDMVDQAMFTTTQKGYNPREVDRFVEQLKDACRALAEEYRCMQTELQQLRPGSETFGG